MEVEMTEREELQSIIEAIRGSKVIGSQASVISKLESLYLSEKFDQALLLDYLATLWEDSTCFSISECILKKTILSICSRYSDCLSQHLSLGLKASTWCERYLQEVAMSPLESQYEDAFVLFHEIILESLRLSLSTTCALTTTPVVGQKMTMFTVENYILELFKLIKTSIKEIKKIQSIASELLKVTQNLLDAIIKLCRAYFELIESDLHGMNIDQKEGLVDEKCTDYASHSFNIIECTIQNLSELGAFAASGGGSLVTILNVSWKGVVSLLQLGKGVLAIRMNVGDIIRNLLSLAIEALTCASNSWFMALAETVIISEAKRTFLPIKFYLLNALRIASEYPCETISLYREISCCILMVSSLVVAFSKEANLRAASEMLVELLEPTSILLLHTLLNAANAKSELRVQVLDWLFNDSIELNSNIQDENVNTSSNSSYLKSIFIMDYDALLGAQALMLGRVVLFPYLLKSSSALKEEVIIGISVKLEYFLDKLVHEDVYSSILCLQIPVFCNYRKSSGITWQSLYSFILHSLKVFMISSASSSVSWATIETFLLQYFFHPHPLCKEIITELWCFLVRHAGNDTVNYTLDILFSLVKTVASSGPVLEPFSAVRIISRQVCLIISCADPASVDRFYESVATIEESNLSSMVLLALLVEGFPLDSLSDSCRELATQKLINSFYTFTERNIKELALSSSLKFCGQNILGLPVHALSSALQHCQIMDPDIKSDKNFSLILEFAAALVQGYKKGTDGMKEHYAKLLGATLVIISNVKNFYGSKKMEDLIFELHTLFIQSLHEPVELLHQCKTSLVSFMSGLSFMKIVEGDGEKLCNVIWDLYHMLLRERHWALVHLVIVAFGHFAARTSCTQLWRFVPSDAALSFDPNNGTHANEERFMLELKGVLEKEKALPDVNPSQEQPTFLASEGTALRDLSKVFSTAPQIPDSQLTIIDDEDHIKGKKRKFPDGICEGVELLQSGLKVVSNALAQSDAAEFRDALLSHVSCLEGTISLLAGLTNKG